MVRPIFVHPQTEFLDRIKTESAGNALTTPSMVQAIQWITDPVQPLSGVFLNPDNPSYSALNFIDLTLTHRPTLPIFLLEGKLSKNKSRADRVTQNTHIRGIFSGVETYNTLVAPLKTQVPTNAMKPRQTVPSTLVPGFVTVPVTDFFTGTHYPFNIFMIGPEGDMLLFAAKDSVIDASYLTLLAQRTEWVFVREEDIVSCRKQIDLLKSELMTNDDMPFQWKSAELMVSAKGLLTEMRKSGVSDSMVLYTQTILNDLYTLMSNIDAEEEGDLYEVIERAKKCDRAIFCASYSMLVCKQLRYERTATLEILGFASVLQDLSLYQTPYGDLSEKTLSKLTPDELIYYKKHPVLSADLVANHTDVPQVTLQVIRQHHERKNKTGFPNRIGGVQLHSMAEVLSLINSYYEVSHGNASDAEIINQLNRNIFPNFSDHIVMAFKQVLGNILKDKILAAHEEQTTRTSN